ncbi:FAD binding domain-containing protein [Nocardia blacklockiae]|nr:FAD binding domain-containing protein [Nocardia blacklockiae]
MDVDTIRELVVARERGDLAALAGNSAVLAGGTWLYSEPQDRLERLVDITALGWPALTATAAGLEIAATCTLAELETVARATGKSGGGAWPSGWSAATLFPQACGALVASYKIRRMATVGGNVCLALPAGAVLAALVALDATASVWGPGSAEWRIPLSRFVLGPGRTVLAPGEVLRSVYVEAAKMRSRTAFRKIALAPLGRSGAVVMGRLDADGRCALTFSAATVRPLVLEFDSVPQPSELDATVFGMDSALWYDDPHGSPAWRRHVSAVLAREVLAELAAGRS